MGVLRSKWFWASALGLLVSGGLLLVAVGSLALVVLTGLAGGASPVALLVEAAVPALAAAVILVPLLALSVVGLLWSLARNASLPRSDLVANAAERLEREYPPLRTVGLSDLLAPPEPSPAEREERALDDLKRRYVNGDLTEAEFERKVDRLVENETVDEARAARERREVLDEGAGRY
ncbi:SHOCT domain-containing protein [Halomicrobium urmianum]|uniref:SHOCT domain-containing protein n=1 Tax=Halomicrobium urmianum TaxID=1586233 RepID=UPI001CD93604|nr:SHOCT domain-containing protein [Halomicrobium urmianum]